MKVVSRSSFRHLIVLVISLIKIVQYVKILQDDINFW